MKVKYRYIDHASGRYLVVWFPLDERRRGLWYGNGNVTPGLLCLIVPASYALADRPYAVVYGQGVKGSRQLSAQVWEILQIEEQTEDSRHSGRRRTVRTSSLFLDADQGTIGHAHWWPFNAGDLLHENIVLLLDVPVLVQLTSSALPTVVSYHWFTREERAPASEQSELFLEYVQLSHEAQRSWDPLVPALQFLRLLHETVQEEDAWTLVHAAALSAIAKEDR